MKRRDFLKIVPTAAAIAVVPAVAVSAAQGNNCRVIETPWIESKEIFPDGRKANLRFVTEKTFATSPEAHEHFPTGYEYSEFVRAEISAIADAMNVPYDELVRQMGSNAGSTIANVAIKSKL